MTSFDDLTKDFDPVDVKKLARKNPIPFFDDNVRFKDDGHLYAYVHNGVPITQGIVSTTGMLKYAFPESDQSEWDRRARSQYGAVKTRVEDYSKRPSARQSYLTNLEARLKTRTPKVREHVSNGGIHSGALLYLMNDVPHKTYDDLLIYLIECRVVRYEVLERNRVVYDFPSEFEAQEFVKAHWRSKTDAGTDMHTNFEKFLNDEEHDPETDEFKAFSRWYEKQTYGVPFRTELLMFVPEYRLAGSLDAIFFNEKTGKYTIVDWKRVRDIDQKVESLNYARVDGAWEIVDKNHPDSFSFGNSTLDKYLLQGGIYLKLFSAARIGEVERIAIVVYQQGTTNLKVYECEGEDLAKVTNKTEAVFNKRLEKLFLEG